MVAATASAVAVAALSAGKITTIAGKTAPGYPGGFSGDGGPATRARLNTPEGLAVDAKGNVYIADLGNDRIRKVDARGTIKTVAGNGRSGFSGDGHAATAARINLSNLGSPCDAEMAADSRGNLYIPDVGNHRVREVSPAGTITTIAGSGNDGMASGASVADGEEAVSAPLSIPCALAVDAKGDLYIVDYGLSVVLKVSGGKISTFAGAGSLNSGSGNTIPVTGGAPIPAVSADIGAPIGIGVDRQGDVFIAAERAAGGSSVVYSVNPNGMLTTMAGSGERGNSAATVPTKDGVKATSEALDITALTADSSGNVYITDTSTTTKPRVREVSRSGIIKTIAGSRTKPNITLTSAGAEPAQVNGDGGPALLAFLYSPAALSVDAHGNVYIADEQRVRKVARG